VVEPLQAIAFAILPVLELHCIRQREAVQERAGVQLDRLPEVCVLQRVFEFHHVDPDSRWIEAQAAAFGDQDFLAKRPPHGMDRPLQEVACALRGRFRPEQSHEMRRSRGSRPRGASASRASRAIRWR